MSGDTESISVVSTAMSRAEESSKSMNRDGSVSKYSNVRDDSRDVEDSLDDASIASLESNVSMEDNPALVGALGDFDLAEFEQFDPDLDPYNFTDPGQMGDEIKAKLKSQAQKLKKVFKKVRQQYDDVVELSVSQAQMQSEKAKSVVPPSPDAPAETDKQKIAALNRRIMELKENLEVSESKARSLSAQR